MPQNIPAHMQDGKPDLLHMCRMTPARGQYTPVPMRNDQRIVARWIEQTAKKRDWSYERLAKESGIKHASTITRALKDDFDGLTRIDTLHQIACGAGVPSPLDFLNGQAIAGALSEELLTELLASVQASIPATLPFSEWPRAVATALHRRLQLLADAGADTLPAQTRPESAADEGAPPPPATTPDRPRAQRKSARS